MAGSGAIQNIAILGSPCDGGPRVTLGQIKGKKQQKMVGDERELNEAALDRGTGLVFIQYVYADVEDWLSNA